MYMKQLNKSEHPTASSTVFTHCRQYVKHETEPYTKARVTFLLAAINETCALLREMCKTEQNTELLRELYGLLDAEHRKAIKLSLLLPSDESVAERAVVHEQLAVDLTSALAEHEQNGIVKSALEHTLIDDADHLYRFSNLIDITEGISAQTLVGSLTEIMPGRHTAAQPHAIQNIKTQTQMGDCDLQTQLTVMIAATIKRHSADFYTTACSLAEDKLSRLLFAEIARIELLHAVIYDSMLPTEESALKRLLLQKYCECYCVFSCCTSETDPRLRSVFDELLKTCTVQFRKAAELCERYENTQCENIIKDGEFPPSIILHSNTEYVRSILVGLEQSDCPLTPNCPSHRVAVEHIRLFGRDYRYERLPHPVPRLRDNTVDNQ